MRGSGGFARGLGSELMKVAHGVTGAVDQEPRGFDRNRAFPTAVPLATRATRRATPSHHTGLVAKGCDTRSGASR